MGLSQNQGHPLEGHILRITALGSILGSLCLGKLPIVHTRGQERAAMGKNLSGFWGYCRCLGLR